MPVSKITTTQQSQIKDSKRASTPTRAELNSIYSSKKKVDNGKISGSDKLKSVGKGVKNTAKSLVSPTSLLVIGGFVVTSTALMVATGGAAAPAIAFAGNALLIAGTTASVGQIGYGAYKAHEAKNKVEAEKAWENIGEGTSGLGLTAAGGAASKFGLLSKCSALLKNTKVANTIANSSETALTALKETAAAFTSGKAKSRIKNVIMQKKPNVILVDGDKTPIVKIDNTGLQKTTHAKMSKSMIEATRPKSKITILNAESDSPEFIDYDIAIKHLQSITEMINNGERVDGVNISFGNKIKIPDLAKQTGLPLTKENIHLYKNELREWVRNPKFSDKITPEEAAELKEDYLAENELIIHLEQLAKKGVRVNISAGNRGANSINLATLAKGTHNVGALDAKGNIVSCSPSHGLVSDYSQGSYNVTPKFNNKEFTGFDITGSGKVEIPATQEAKQSFTKSNYIEQPYSDKVISKAEFEELKSIRKRVLEVLTAKKQISESLKADMANFTTKTEGKLVPPNMLKDYFEFFGLKDYEQHKGMYTNLTGERKFYELKISKDGKLGDDYNPDGSGRPSMGYIFGTSYSSPRNLGLHLMKEYPTNGKVAEYAKDVAKDGQILATTPFLTQTNHKKR